MAITLEELQNSKGTVILKVEGPGCTACNLMSLFDKSVCKELGMRFETVHAGLPLVAKLGVRSIPLYFVYQDGKQIKRSKGGYMSQVKFREFLS